MDEEIRVDDLVVVPNVGLGHPLALHVERRGRLERLAGAGEHADPHPQPVAGLEHVGLKEHASWHGEGHVGDEGALERREHARLGG